MNDCREKAIQDMTRNLSHLDEWEHIVKSLLTPFENPTSVENTTDGKHLETAIETLRSDLGYVLSKLESMEPELSALQREVRKPVRLSVRAVYLDLCRLNPRTA